MSRSRTYRTSLLKNVSLDRILEHRKGQAVSVGCDVSKADLHVILRWGPDDFERPWKVDNPLEISKLVQLLKQLGIGREMSVALEPTGTYGDALRQQLKDAEIDTRRVSPKASHDYAEIFDSVPSKHDGKDAAVVAELAAIGKSAKWSFDVDDWEQELADRVDWLETQRRWLSICYGNLEGLLARYWPEAIRTLPLRSGVLLKCLAEFGGPAGLAADAEAAELLVRWGRGHLDSDKATALVSSAATTVGVKQTAADCRRVRRYAQAALDGRRETRRFKKELKELAKGNEVLERQGRVVGAVTASVLWVHLGDPRKYDSAGAYRKAMGLNLKERSSGKWQGRLKISKRGSSAVRRWLYFSAMRLTKQAGVKQWYESQKAKTSSTEGSPAKRELTGVLRKLALALHRIGTHDEEFDSRRLFNIEAMQSAT